jgi:hypothetical protein
MAEGKFPGAAARLRALEAFPLTEAERQALGGQFALLGRGLEALAAFLDAAVEPATGFDPTLGEDA